MKRALLALALLMNSACGTKASGTAATTITYTVGFDWKFKFYCVTNANDGGGAAHAVLSLGWQVDFDNDAQSSRNVGFSCEDNAATSDTYRTHAVNSIRVANGTTGAIDLSARATSQASGVTTITVATAPASSKDIHWWALGGSDVTATIDKVDAPSATGTTPSVTGLSHAPNVALCMSIQRSTIEGSNDANAALNFGIAVKTADGTIKQVSLGWVSDDAAGAANTIKYMKSGSWLTSFTTGSASSVDRAHITAFNSDGFTITWDRINSGATHTGNHVYYAALTVPDVELFLDTITTSDSSQVFGTTPWYPGLAVVASHGAAENSVDTATDGLEAVFGATDGTNQWSNWVQDRDAQDPMDANSYQSATATYDDRDTGALTADGSLTFTSFDPTGITFAKSAPATSRYVAMLVFPASPQAPPVTVANANAEAYAPSLSLAIPATVANANATGLGPSVALALSVAVANALATALDPAGDVTIPTPILRPIPRTALLRRSLPRRRV